MSARQRPPWAVAARVHLLQFDAPLRAAHGRRDGVRMLLAFAGVAGVLPWGWAMLAPALGWRGVAGATFGYVAVLLATFAVLHRAAIGLPFAAIGLRPWRDWTRGERLYLVQVLPLAVLLFGGLFWPALSAAYARQGAAGFVLATLLPGLLWGVFQEFAYRGWLQTELMRRFGGVAGWLLANLLFTVGPLHAAALFGPAGVDWGLAAAVFGIGLYFGLLYWRSGNLWLPAVLHGLWPPNMT